MPSFTLLRVPMPPSDNRLHRTSGRTYVRYKSQEYQQYLDLMEDYRLINYDMVLKMRYAFKRSQCLKVEISLYFNTKSLLTKDKRYKRIDAQNRVKALCDSLGKLLDKDDSSFFELTLKKKLSDTPESYTDIVVSDVTSLLDLA
jgi:Holliday junction resolvase RusA-like endonuclease